MWGILPESACSDIIIFQISVNDGNLNSNKSDQMFLL